MSLIAAFLCLPFASTPAYATPLPNKPSVVRVRKTGGHFELLRNGRAYTIKGAGGDAGLAKLAAAGGNSIRTWGADQFDATFAEAQKNGLTVSAGVWLLHPDGLDYTNADAVAAQYKRCVDLVKKYRNEPSLLVWGWGNEAEGEGNQVAYWKALQQIAAMSHREDPNHPTMTVICEDIVHKLAFLKQYCPDIDIVGVNSYGPSASVAEHFAKANIDRPYVLTEWGTVGHWENGKTRWGAPYEPTSTEKVKTYRDGYDRNVVANRGTCLGSYAFLWGHKVEASPTWFGLFLADGSRTPMLDVLTTRWTGKKPIHPCPTISKIAISEVDHLTPGSSIPVSVQAKASRGACRVTWSILKEIQQWTGSEPNTKAWEVPDATIEGHGAAATIHLPSQPGAYRIYVVAHDAFGGAATASVPIFVG